MNIPKIKTIIKENFIFYLIAFLVAFGMKYFYSKSDSSDLTWILTPTVWWVRILSGIPFVYDPFEGYVSHTYHFVIAPSCSGVQFMIISLATLIFSYVHHMDTRRKKFLFTVLSLAASYLVTIAVNTIRIVLSIYLPLYLEQKSLSGGLLTPSRLHTLIGTSVYFTSLLLLYHIAGLITKQSFFRCLPPIFFYFAIILGIPFLNSAYRNTPAQFTEYAMLITYVCLIILALFCLGAVLKTVLLSHYHFRVRSR